VRANPDSGQIRFCAQLPLGNGSAVSAHCYFGKRFSLMV
jgi:hypothetical protein